MKFDASNSINPLKIPFTEMPEVEGTLKFKFNKPDLVYLNGKDKVIFDVDFIKDNSNSFSTLALYLDGYWNLLFTHKYPNSKPRTVKISMANVNMLNPNLYIVLTWSPKEIGIAISEDPNKPMMFNTRQ